MILMPDPQLDSLELCHMVCPYLYSIYSEADSNLGEKINIKIIYSLSSNGMVLKQ